MVKRKILNVLTLLLIVATLFGVAIPVPVAQAGTETYNHIIPFTVTDNSGFARTNLPVIINFDVSGNLVVYGLTNATCTNTYADSSGAGNSPVGSGTAYNYLMATDNITVVIPSLPAYGSVTVNLYTGYSPLQTSFYTTVGEGGYITIADNASGVDKMELGDNFTVEIKGWVDTDAGSGKSLVRKPPAFDLYVSDNVSKNITACIDYKNDMSYVANDYCHKAAGVTSPAGALLSFEGWVYFDGLGNPETVVGCGDASGYPSWFSYKDAADKILVRIGNVGGGGWAAAYESTNSVNATSWYYITASYDANATPELHVYLNGNEFPGADTGDGTNIYVPNSRLVTGAVWNGAYINFLTGDIDEVRISDKARTEAEHDTAYNGGDGIPFTVDGNTVSLWHFNASAGNPADEMGVNDLVNVGATWATTSPVAGGGEDVDASVTATGVASGEHTVKVTMVDNTGAGWLAGWDNRIRFDVDADKVDADLTHFPMLVKLSSSAGIGSDDVTAVFDELGANHLKLAVTEGDGVSEIYVEVEKWDNGSEEAWLWCSSNTTVTANATDTTFYLYYDNDHADNVARVGVPNDAVVHNVWDGNFVLVDHLPDGVNNASTYDSTSNNNDGAKTGANEPIEITGKVGDAQSGDGVNDVVTIATVASLNFGAATDFTLEAIVKPDPACVNNAGIINKKAAYFGQGYGLHFNSVGADFYRLILHAEDGIPNQIQFGNNSNIDITVFSYIAGAFDRDGNATLHILGGATETKSSSMATVGDIDNAGNLELLSGNAVEAKAIEDEVRISNILRPTAWLEATYDTCWDNFIDFIPSADGKLGDFSLELQIYIDSDLKDHALGVSVPDTAFDWTLMENNVMPYGGIEGDAAFYKHYVDGNLIVWYEPNALITSDTLPDRQGGDEDGTITWGTNSDIIITGKDIMDSESATGVGVSSAMMQGELFDIGTYASAYLSFEYGLDTNYGYTTSETSAAAEQTFSVTLTGLTPNTTYHYRAIARSGIVYSYGEDTTFTTAFSTASEGSTTPLIRSTGVFSGYQQVGDLLFTAEVVLTYPPYYPTDTAYKYFQMQLIDTDGTTILGASPIAQWGDRPESIYCNATVVTDNLTYGEAYQIRIANVSSSNITVNTAETLVPTDWRGDDLNELDAWCIGVATSMQNADGTIFTDPYLQAVTGYGLIITDTAGGFFATGIPNIARIRPHLFTAGEYSGAIAPLSGTVGYPGGTTLTDRVGATIVADVTTVGTIFNITGQQFLFYVILATILGCIVYTVSNTQGFGALGALCLSLPIVGASVYFNIMNIVLPIIVIIIFAFLFVRQFIWKTM